MKKLILVLSIAILAVACNKNQKAVRYLNGEWEVTSLKETNLKNDSIEIISLSNYSAVFKFDKCRLKKDDFCSVKITTIESGITEVEEDLFRVTDKGKALEIKEDANSNIIIRLKIVELDKKTLKLEFSDGDEKAEFELKKK